ncbi:MAG: hypothetical protein FD131_3742 [Rhodocyclaceae bacterium]|nr:MAG: hypothetical protein FD131_3742 [Rhodocyclaceae bacterium]
MKRSLVFLLLSDVLLVFGLPLSDTHFGLLPGAIAFWLPYYR